MRLWKEKLIKEMQIKESGNISRILRRAYFVFITNDEPGSWKIIFWITSFTFALTY